MQLTVNEAAEVRAAMEWANGVLGSATEARALTADADKLNLYRARYRLAMADRGILLDFKGAEVRLRRA